MCLHYAVLLQSSIPQNVKFKSNKIDTAKYNLITLIPRFLFEQFRR